MLKTKRVLSFLFVIVMSVSTMQVPAFAANIPSVSNSLEAEFKIVNEWTGYYQGEITLKNVGTKTIENWRISCVSKDDMENIWNAEITKHEENIYTIKNAEHNANIAPGASVSFGFQSKMNGEEKGVTDICLLDNVSTPITEDFEIIFTTTSDWGDGYNAQIEIKNDSNQKIENWKLEFDFEQKIDTIWNAAILQCSDNHYIINNAEHNINIPANGSVIFGFGGNAGNIKNEPENYVLYSVKEDVETKESADEENVDENIPDADDNDNADDTDDTDGNRIVTLHKTSDDWEEGDAVKPILVIELQEKQMESLVISKVKETDLFLNPNLPGYIGNAYDFHLDGEFESATLTYEFDESLLHNPDFEPTIYYWNAKLQQMEELPNQVRQGNQVSVSLEHFSPYILLNKKIFDEVWEDEIKPPATQKRIDLALLVDDSRSMYYTDPGKMRVAISKRLISELEPKDRVSVVRFHSYASAIPNLKSGGDYRISQLYELDNVSSAGGTPDICNALGFTSNMFAKESDNGANKIMILMTSGEDPAFKIDARLNDALWTAMTNHVTIHVVGFGAIRNETELKFVAHRTGGNYYHASNTQDRTDLFNMISDRIFNTDTEGDDEPTYAPKVKPPTKPTGNITTQDVQADVDKGLYSWEDYYYLLALYDEVLSGTSTTYEEFYAVACCVRNRVNDKTGEHSNKNTYKDVVSQEGQFDSYRDWKVEEVKSTPPEQDIIKAAVMVLRDEQSTIGTYRFFFGRNDYEATDKRPANKVDLWFDKEKAGQNLPIVVGKQYLRNAYCAIYETVNNDSLTPDGDNYVTLYSYKTKKWYDE